MPPRDYYKSKSFSGGSKKSKPSGPKKGKGPSRSEQRLQSKKESKPKVNLAKQELDRRKTQKSKKESFFTKAKNVIMKKGDHVSAPTSTTKKTWEAAGKVPAGQHKLRSQFDRLSAKYGPGWEKTEQAKVLGNYLSGVAKEKGGGLGARDPSYGGLSSWDQLDPDSEAYRQQLLNAISGPGAKGPASQYANTGIQQLLNNYDVEKARGNLTPDQYFKFRQQLMSADPTPGNMEYKKAFPWSSGQALEGIMQMAPVVGTAGRFLKGALGKAQDVGQGIAQGIPSGLMGLLNKAKGVATPKTRYTGLGSYAGEKPWEGYRSPDEYRQQVSYGQDQQESMYPQGYGDFLLNPPPPTRPGAGGPTVQGFPDQDGDGIDDRWQAGPGQARPGIEQLPDQGQGVIGGMPGMYQPGYGGSVGKENDMRTADFRDSDGDGVDDRDQAGPGQSPWRGYGQKFAGATPGLPQAPSALTPGSALAMSPITQQLQFQQQNQQPNANWQQWNQNLRRFS